MVAGFLGRQEAQHDSKTRRKALGRSMQSFRVSDVVLNFLNSCNSCDESFAALAGRSVPTPAKRAAAIFLSMFVGRGRGELAFAHLSSMLHLRSESCQHSHAKCLASISVMWLTLSSPRFDTLAILSFICLFQSPLSLSIGSSSCMCLVFSPSSVRLFLPANHRSSLRTLSCFSRSALSEAWIAPIASSNDSWLG